MKSCRLQPLMRETRDAVAAVLENRSLASMVSGASKPKRKPVVAGRKRAATRAA
jgi:DNA-binding IscR family transcriptional regulator